MMDLRSTVILIGAFGAAAAAVGLMRADGKSWPAALLVAGAAFWALLLGLPSLIPL